MLEKLTTPEFWQAQAAVVMLAPWVIIPLLLFVLVLGWILKGLQDSGEIRGLKSENRALEADKKAAETRLELAHDKQLAVTKQLEVLEPVAQRNEAEIDQLNTKVARMESSIRDALLPQLAKAAQTSVGVTGTVHNLASANLAVRYILSPPFQATRKSE
jgi:hypothetical protein